MWSCRFLAARGGGRGTVYGVLREVGTSGRRNFVVVWSVCSHRWVIGGVCEAFLRQRKLVFGFVVWRMDFSIYLSSDQSLSSLVRGRHSVLDTVC